MRKNRKNQRGQAILELLAGLIALLAVMLGLLFVAGLGINSLRIYKDARFNAELAMQRESQPPLSNDGSDIATWSYRRRDVGTSIELPYDPDSLLVTKSGTLSTGEFSSVSDSAENEENYQFATLNEISLLPGVDSSRFSRFNQLGNSARIAANLVGSGSSFGGHPVLTIDPSEIGGAGSPVATQALEEFFYRLCGVRVRTQDLVNQETNHVYFPRINQSEN